MTVTAPVTVHIASMRRRHVRSVVRIEEEVYPRPWTTSLFLSELALHSTRAYYVARVGRELVGYAGLMMTGEDGHVTTIAVAPTWQRRGIATRLLLTLARAAISRGATGLTLEVRFTNHAAQDLYRSFGFTPVGIRKNYYPEVNEDAIVMWVHDVHNDQYRELLDRIEGTVPGETVYEERLW
jgi:ribosomal-protein-alanine N-acetyltransferase